MYSQSSDNLSKDSGGLTVEKIFAPLKQLSPQGEQNTEGHCMACTRLTGKILHLGMSPQPISEEEGDNTDVYTDEDTQVATIEREGHLPRADRVWAWLTQDAKNDCIYAVDAQDHAYNFVKDVKGRLYLVDSDKHVFRSIKSASDLQVRFLVEGEPLDYNYADPVIGKDDDMDIYNWGSIHDSYASQLNKL